MPFQNTLEVMQAQYPTAREGCVGIKALVNAEFTPKPNLAHLRKQRIAVLGRVPKCLQVQLEDQSVHVVQTAGLAGRAGSR